MTIEQVLRIGAVVPRTEAEGPGRRFAVWAQGCTIRCVGCFNPHLWGEAGGHLVAVDDLVDEALGADVEGVTLLGGEPFEQAVPFAEFANRVRQGGLSVMVFTGYTREHLESRDGPVGAAELLGSTDLLVDGKYIAGLPDTARPWVGSTNQRFHILSERYRDLDEAALEASNDRIEVRVSAAGDVVINGWASVDQLDALLVGTVPSIARGRVR